VAGCGEMGRGGECANLTVAGSPGVWAACWISLSMLACLNVEQMFLLFACGIITFLCKLAASKERRH